MAGVTVEFGAKDTGLEATLQNVKNDLERLNTEMQNSAMSTDEAASALREMKKLQGLEAQLQEIADSTTNVGDAASSSSSEIEQSSESMNQMGDSATQAGESSEMGFAKMAAAVAAGQLAVEVAMGGIKLAIDSVIGLFDQFGEAIDKGAELDILSTRTGVASGELARLGRALENTGMSAEMIGPIFDRFNKAIAEVSDGSGEAGEALAKLGIPIERLKALSPDEQFRAIGEALGGVADRSERADMAMDIFGRGSGTRLLRLFENFEGTMARVDQQLGAYPTIMNQLSSAFENAGTEINAVRKKFNEFATGLISKFLPAVEAIAMGLASFDAAAFGERIGAALAGATNAMNGFKAAMDAIKVGEFGLAFDIIFESIKVQAKETANQIYRALSAAFKSAGVFLGEIFNPSGALITTIINTFKMLGNRVAVDLQRSLADALGGNWLTDGIAKNLNIAANETNIVANQLEDSLKGSAGRIAEQFANAGAALPDTFKEKYGEAEGIFTDIEQHNARIKQLTEQIAQSTGLSAEEAGGLAENYLASKTAADEAAKATRNLGDRVYEAGDGVNRIRRSMETVGQATMDQPVGTFRQQAKKAREDLEGLKDFIGEDLSGMSLDDILDKLGITSYQTDPAREKLEKVQQAIKDIGEAPVAEVTPEVDEENPKKKLEKIREYLDNIDAPDATPEIKQETVKTEVASAKKTITESFRNLPATIKLNADESIKAIRKAIAEPIEVNLTPSGGAGGGDSGLASAVEAIKGFVEKIETKLPMQALA